MAQGSGSATRGLALGGLLAACLLLGVADAATHRVDWSFNADNWSKGKSFRAGDVLGEQWPSKPIPFHHRQQLLVISSSKVQTNAYYGHFFSLLRAEFNYDRSVHNVVAVDAGGYSGCRSSGTPYSSGSDRVTLGPGTNYFICSLSGHCGMGMKMIVNAS